MSKEINYGKPIYIGKNTLPLDFNIFGEYLSEAKYSLGLLEGSQRKLQNPNLLISPLVAKEATVSSKIEGTQSTVSDVYLYDAGGKPKHSDTVQVNNYRKAVMHAVLELEKGRPLSLGLIKELHKILLEGVRYKGKLGEFRKCQVWIAEKEGDPIEEALYVPPEPQLINDYMDDFIYFIENDKNSAIIKAGIAHYQFEAVHPFEDGNGRLGRLLIPLILLYEKKISTPILYLSGYFESHRDEYMNSLRTTDNTGDYEKWLSFFTKSVSEQLKDTQNLIDDLYELYNRIKEEFSKSKSPFINSFLDFVFEKPMFTVSMAKKGTGIKSNPTAVSLIREFQRKGFIVELPVRHSKGAKVYAFNPLIKLL